MRAFRRTNIGSCSFWNRASPEPANTAWGRWSEEQSKQGTCTGEQRHTTAAAGRTLTCTRVITHTHATRVPSPPEHRKRSLSGRLPSFYSSLLHIRTNLQLLPCCFKARRLWFDAALSVVARVSSVSHKCTDSRRILIWWMINTNESSAHTRADNTQMSLTRVSSSKQMIAIVNTPANLWMGL